MDRIQREKRTVAAMIALYCHGHHASTGDLCTECRELQDYTLARLNRCPFGVQKPTCAKCSIHCYKPDRRAEIKEVMRYAGPRMLCHYPLLALMHQIDSARGEGSRNKADTKS